MQMDEVMILDKAIENLQSNLRIVVKCNNNKLFEGTIGELSTKYSTLGQRRIKYQPFYDSTIKTYIVEIE